MQGKFIKTRFRSKVNDWIESIDNEAVKIAIKKDLLITGGAIVSLLQGDEPNDYDCYFRSFDSLKLVADYYINKFNETFQNTDANTFAVRPIVQSCFFYEDTANPLRSRWIVTDNIPQGKEKRLRIFIRSSGAAAADFDPYEEDDIQYRKQMRLLNKARQEKLVEEKPKDRKKYQPVFITNNAITLSDGIQLVLRFYGEPEDIHKNYDFVHTTSYWTARENELVMPARALEAIINKELFYVGSKYPLCSIIRSRKFIQRGWNINAGQYLKMVLQLQDLNLKNLHVFEEQLIGVDSFYFERLLDTVEEMRKDSSKILEDTGYLINLINNVFEFEEGEVTN